MIALQDNLVDKCACVSLSMHDIHKTMRERKSTRKCLRLSCKSTCKIRWMTSTMRWLRIVPFSSFFLSLSLPPSSSVAGEDGTVDVSASDGSNTQRVFPISTTSLDDNSSSRCFFSNPSSSSCLFLHLLYLKKHCILISIIHFLFFPFFSSSSSRRTLENQTHIRCELPYQSVHRSCFINVSIFVYCLETSLS